DVTRMHIIDNGLHVYGGIDAAQFCRRRYGLGKVLTRILFVIKGLSLEVGKLHKITINNSKMPRTRAYQQFCSDTSQSSGSDQDETGGRYPRLTFRSNRRKANLAGIAVFIFQDFASHA